MTTLVTFPEGHIQNSDSMLIRNREFYKTFSIKQESFSFPDTVKFENTENVESCRYIKFHVQKCIRKIVTISIGSNIESGRCLV